MTERYQDVRLRIFLFKQKIFRGLQKPQAKGASNLSLDGAWQGLDVPCYILTNQLGAKAPTVLSSICVISR